MQRELAERVGISASMLSLVEAGNREPTISLLREISRALEIPASILFAVALDDQPVGRPSAQARSVHEFTQYLYDATLHSLAARRARRQRASRKNVARQPALLGPDVDRD